MKYLLDLSLEVDSSEINYEHDLHFIITKIIDGQKVVIELPTVDSYSGEGLKNGEIYEYYSVIGLSVVFVGVAMPVIIMGGFLEISKIAIATYLHDKWKETYTALKIYLTIALITLSVITSLGIYGLLSTGYPLSPYESRKIARKQSRKSKNK